MSEKFLAGRTAMVTGGASGMGRAMALAFAGAGANVAIGSLLADKKDGKTEGEVSYLPGKAELVDTQKKLSELGVECLAMGLDVTSVDSVQEFYEATIKTFGKVDVLANAAGITAEQTVCGHSDSLWDKVMDVNLNGTFRSIRAVLPGMIEQKWGRVINIASTAAAVGAPTSAVYCASKAAVVGLTRCVALEGAEHGVTCNSISPGWTNTNFGRDWMGDIAEKQEQRKGEEYIADVKADNPQNRLIQPEEIAATALFLCQEKARGMTMQDLTVSAGSVW